MDRARVAYYLRALAAEIEKEGDRVVVRCADIFPAGDRLAAIDKTMTQEPVDIFSGIAAEDDTEKTPAVAISAPAVAIIRRHWTNRRHAAYTPEEMAFIAKCHETGDNPQTISDKLDRRFGFRVSVRAVRHRIAKLEGREAV